MKPCKIKIVGATGYSGGELLRLLIQHPAADIVAVTSSSAEEPKPLHYTWPLLRQQTNLYLTKENSKDACGAEVVFLCTPHGVSMSLAGNYLDRGCVVIDLSADFRFENPDDRIGWYPEPHPPIDLCQRAVYGMPELFREEIRTADLIANPGCYATAEILTLYPGIQSELFDVNNISISAASGVTGAGIKPKPHLHHPELDQNFFAYRIGHHQHLPEIVGILKKATGRIANITFVPHVLPLRRGIVSTVFCSKAPGIQQEDIWETYRKTYHNEPFIRMYPLGETPNLHAVFETNYVDISIHEDQCTGKIVIVSAEDNLGKGAAGQAVQNFNVRMGYPENTALQSNPKTLEPA